MADNNKRPDFHQQTPLKFDEAARKPQEGYGNPPPPYVPTSVVVGQPLLNPQPGQQGVIFIQREQLPPNGNAICFSVFVLLCCSLALGIIGLVFASKLCFYSLCHVTTCTPKIT